MLGARDAKTGRDRQLGVDPHLLNQLFHPRRELNARSRDPGDCDAVDETAGVLADQLHALGRRGRRDHKNGVERRGPQPSGDGLGFFHREIRHDDSRDPGLSSLGRELSRVVSEDRVDVGHQHDRSALAGDSRCQLEAALDSHAVVERDLPGALDDRTVRQRIRMRYSYLERRNARRRQPLPHFDRALAVGVPAHHVGDELQVVVRPQGRVEPRLGWLCTLRAPGGRMCSLRAPGGCVCALRAPAVRGHRSSPYLCRRARTGRPGFSRQVQTHAPSLRRGARRERARAPA